MALGAEEKWSVTRKQGRASFVLHFGVIRFGVVFGLAWALPHLIWAQEKFVLSALVGLSVCLAGGALLGFITWAINEHEYINHGQE